MNTLSVSPIRVVEGEILVANDAARKVRVIVQSDPFSQKRTEHFFDPGDTLLDILLRVCPTKSLLSYMRVYVGEARIYADYIDCVRPKPGSTVTIKAVPRGGDKDPLRILLSIALIALAFYVPGALGLNEILIVGELSVGGLVTAGILIGGTLALNALFPPPTPKLTGFKSDPTFFLSGARNVVRPFSPIPRVLGTIKQVPPLGALPYTEVVGDSQYLRIIFVWGYGPLDIADIKIGETLLEEFDEVEIEHLSGIPGEPTEFTLYSNQAFEESLSVLLEQVADWVQRTSKDDADELSLDVTFLRGLVRIDNNGKRNPVTVAFEVQYADTGTTDWKGLDQAIAAQPDIAALSVFIMFNSLIRWDSLFIDIFTGLPIWVQGGFSSTSTTKPLKTLEGVAVWLANVRRTGPGPITNSDIAQVARTGDEPFADPFNDFQVTESSPTARTVDMSSGTLNQVSFLVTASLAEVVRRGFRWTVPARGKYDIRVRRVTADSTSDRVSDEATWTALRTITNESPINFDGLAATALRIKATEQLNGVVDNLNAICTSIIPDWNGSAWVNQTTNNPASCYREVLQGSANKQALGDARVGLQSLEDWHDFCVTKGFAFNMTRDYKASVEQALRDVASAGRATLAIVEDNKWGVIWDDTRTVPVQHFSSRNIKDYSATKLFPHLPHAFRVIFQNEDKNFAEDERLVYDDGFDINNTTEIERLELIGITNSDLVWKHGRYHIAQVQLRPEEHVLEVDIEYLVAQRGELIKFVHDVPKFSIGSARILIVNDNGSEATSIVVNDMFPVNVTSDYAIRARAADGTSIVENVTVTPDANGQTDTLVFVTPPTLGLGSAPEVGDLVLFGEVGQESVDLIIKSIRPVADKGAQLVCVDYAPGVLTADSGEIPPFDSQITDPISSVFPSIVDIRSDEDVLVIHPDGGWDPQIHVVISFSTLRPADAAEIQARYRRTNSTESYKHVTTPISAAFLNLGHVAEGDTYDIQLRYLLDDGNPGIWSPIHEHTVIGATTPPPDVLILMRNVDQLDWDYPNPPGDFAGFLVRHAVGTNITWEQASPLHRGVHTESHFSLAGILIYGGAQTILVKAVDIAGNVSENPALMVLNLGDPLIDNIVITRDQDAANFPGTIVNCTREAGPTLQAVDDGSLYLVNGGDPYLPIPGDPYLGIAYLEMSWAYDVVLAASEFPGHLLFSLDIEGQWLIEFKWAALVDYSPWPGKLSLDSDVSVNGMTRSEEYDHVDWTKSDCTVSADAAVAPDGETTADKIIPDSGSFTFIEAYQDMSVTIDEPYTQTYFIKEDDWRYCQIIGPSGVYGTFYVNFDTRDGVITANVQGSSPALAIASVEVLPDDWFLIRVTQTAIATSGTGRLSLNFIDGPMVARGASVTGDGSTGLLVWGGQFVEGNVPKDYTKTVADLQPTIYMRTTIQGGVVRGVINNFDMITDVEDESERFASFSLAAGGTRLTLTKTYRSIEVVNISMLTGSSAVKVEIMDKDATLGPLLQAFNSGGSGVAATVDVTIQGVKG